MFRRLVLLAGLSVVAHVAVWAQGPRPFPSGWERPWWDSPVVQDLNLTEAQQNEIRATVKEYRDRASPTSATKQ
jgi:Spy/CpxP family protein refolding chaperone